MLTLGIAAAHAGGLDGTWRVDLPRTGGVILHTYLILHQTGASLDGTVVMNGAVDLPLRRAHLEGTDAVFSVDWGTDFRVRPDGGQIRVVLIYGGKDREEAIGQAVPEAEARPPAVLPLPAVTALPANGLALTPPMGWNSWNHFAGAVDDRVVRETAEAMVRTGMADAGYRYINIDDTWESGRDPQGNIQPNQKFPDMKALADAVHRLGLKLGIYSSPGPATCGGYEGSYGHEAQDAATYAAWGIDYLKYDWCSAGRVYGEPQLRATYQKMGDALQRSGRPIVYSFCEYGEAAVWVWGPQAGANLWRTTGDIQDNWKSMSANGFSQDALAPYAAPGHWNDPDMLEVGNGGMSATEYQTHFSLWSLLAAPLIAGNDLRHMSEETIGLLTNREVIAIDQDPLGHQARRIWQRDGIEIWARPLADGRWAAGIFNRTDAAQPVRVTWSDLGLKSAPAGLRDLWLHRPEPADPDGWAGSIPAHGVKLLRTD
jgi:alpha-galactosidase